jgi:hypothetical protein
VKIKLCLILFFTILLSKTTFAQSMDLRAAFCLDYTAFIVGNYEKQKAYNRCIENAKTLIKEYEESKKKQAEEARIFLQEAEERRELREERREKESRLERERDNREYARRQMQREIQAKKEKENFEKKFDAF